jgi:acyl-CoA dehydrogenase
MDPWLNPEQKELRNRVLQLCEEKLQPFETRIGETNILSREIAAALAEAGLFRLFVPRQYGNSTDAPSLTSICMVRELLAQYSLNAELIFAVQGLGGFPVTLAGNAEQQARYCPAIASGEKIFAFALTEADAGSDVRAIATHAEKTPEGYRIDGQKKFISLAPDADIYFVLASAGEDAKGKTFSAFVVEKGTTGFDPGERMELVAAHVIGMPKFTGCVVPEKNLLGEFHRGLRIALATLDFFRTSVAAGALGLAERALQESLRRVKQRQQFGKPIGDNQAIQMKLASMATEIEAARGLIYKAAYLKDRGQARITIESSMAKLYATEMAQRVIDQAVQIHGGDGVIRGSVVERLYRHIRPMRIYEGTSEIQQSIIARAVLSES